MSDYERQHGLERAQEVLGPIWQRGRGYRVVLYFATEGAAQGFAAFAAAGWTAHQEHVAPVIRWEPHGGGEAHPGPLPPHPALIIHSVDTRSDGVITIGYSALGAG